MFPIVFVLFAAGSEPAKPVAALKPLTDRDAWRRLPRVTPSLPVWARTLAVSQPKTTAGLLALDHLHRANNPLGVITAAKLRWTVADELNCKYALWYAEADLKRAGWSDDDLSDLRNQDLNPSDKLLTRFARKLTVAGYLVTDEDVAALVRRFGPEKTVAIVHTVAFANFHDRILLSLGSKVEPDGPYAPVAMMFDPTQPASEPAPERPTWETVRRQTPPIEYTAPPEWEDISPRELEANLSSQKARTGRIPLPPKSRFANMPPDVKAQTDRIVWMTVSAGYQPELTQAWFAAFRAYQEESRSDRVFSSSLFWVVTRANDCFY